MYIWIYISIFNIEDLYNLKSLIFLLFRLKNFMRKLYYFIFKTPIITYLNKFFLKFRNKNKVFINKN